MTFCGAVSSLNAATRPRIGSAGRGAVACQAEGASALRVRRGHERGRFRPQRGREMPPPRAPQSRRAMPSVSRLGLGLGLGCVGSRRARRCVGKTLASLNEIQPTKHSRRTLEREPDIAATSRVRPHTYRPHRHATRAVRGESARPSSPPRPDIRTSASSRLTTADTARHPLAGP